MWSPRQWRAHWLHTVHRSRLWSNMRYFFLHTDMHSPLDSIPHIFGRMHAPVHRRTCFQHICTHTRSHAPSIPQQTFCCFLCLSLFLLLFLCVFFCMYCQTCVRTLPYTYAVVDSTTRNWAHVTSKHPPKSLKKWGKVIMVGSRRVFILFLILGRRADHPMFFHIFSISFLP